MNRSERLSGKLELRAQILKALAHPTRLLFVEELGKGERCVCELQGMVDLDMSTVSKHLSVLKGVGLVTDQKRGNQVFYTLQTPCILRIFDCVEQAVRANLQKQVEIFR
ncbi:MAG: metalloregulator ArsR/SmtB family transcription factor [Candidatus Sumerlaeaceae bacterium]|nr:metalloregulator ArsR/SmtB family transcription factor [Candidatus Sumerlaeaceae bacterium]